MSLESPWISLAIDWHDSAMFDDSNHGVRLAWIALLCFAKAQGRAGKVRMRNKAFAQTYRLSVESVTEMLARCERFGAVRIEGDLVTVVNWSRYQHHRAWGDTDKKHRKNAASDSDLQQRGETQKTSPTGTGTGTGTGTEPPNPPSQRRGAKKTQRITAETVPVPDGWNTGDVLEAIRDWLDYKAKRGEAYRDAGYLGRKIREFETAGPAAFIAAVNASIGSNYAGLFPPKNGVVTHGDATSRVGAGQRYRPS